uniref:VLIG-type G domain-containing protein n=1 Tax=Xiphophorus maculatus TaxID=8083 RepID=A0A3B5QEJ8_XIPMA
DWQYVPRYFLNKLMMAKATAITVDSDDWFASSNEDDSLNPLDLITALFLCSDGFVHQKLALKMSMCQFSVPLLLPNCDTQQCTLMLWAMRDIVKKYRPSDLSESKGFIEERIVLSELPMISFVRLGECSLSKSEILNKLLSNSQQYHDTFVHHNMECGDIQRRISNGLTEMTWYLPCGNKNMDIFSEPVAIANLRGDIASFETQFSFLCQTSAAVFVFFDQLDSECELLMNKSHKAQIFLVGNQQSKNFRVDSVEKLVTSLALTENNIITKNKLINEATFVKKLKKIISDVVKNPQMKMSIEQMADVAHELGIIVDEDSPEYKIWKELTCLEMEERQRKELRKKQNDSALSKAMTCFISAISSSHRERCYFLKWMQMNLDNLSRTELSGLRELYKEKCKDSENKQEIKEIDQQLSSSSLGVEHFFREMGQIYEASLYLPETDPLHQQLQHLPKLCAQLLLDGFPLELVDGDASNIPLRWVSDVLSQLNDLVSPKNKILVVSVLGVQSTGKSTLLNTMFGVQFAVSSGRCTRGAFMLLIKVNEDFKKVLNCDFMMIIDTEGLKSPELAQLDNSHEHDNELATLVVGLSDITIINIAMENSTEMKDILQIVVHAFLRMKEVDKKPQCQFVHQNVSDVSAHEKNLRDRKLLLEQLNEMTQAAAKMEKKEKYKSFTDVMEYNPDTGNCYIPGLWNGNPPMAPVNAGYSEIVYELKKNIIQQLGKFREWITSLWNAVKHENFIFSFRNSLVADAYMRLCTEYNQWEWEFKKEMYKWVTTAETRISNFGSFTPKSQISDMNKFIIVLKSEAITELTKWETKTLDSLKTYFDQPEGHVYLVEGYREDFSNSIKSLRRQTERSMFNQITAAADIKKGLKELDKIRDTYTEKIEKAVFALIDECHKKKVQMTDRDLDENFDKMWTETLRTLAFSEQQTSNIYTSPFTYKPKGSNDTIKDKGKGAWCWTDHVKARQEIADSIISACNDCISDQIKRKTNYHDTYIQEILHIIDKRLNKTDVDIDMKFEVSLKQHICGSAARKFQKIHESFIQENDPYKSLQKHKEKIHKPNSETFQLTNVLPINIFLDLISKSDFESFKSYIRSYEDYVKWWISERIRESFSSQSTICELEDKHLKFCMDHIDTAFKKATAEKSDSLKTFVVKICTELHDKLVISQDALDAFMVLNNVDQEQFAHWLKECVQEMTEALTVKFKNTQFETKLSQLHIKPENELFTRVIGCGKRCPFCKVPCDAGGENHTQHFASMHRPEGLGWAMWDESQKLTTDICSSLVMSDEYFHCRATKGEWHPYKEYREIYPDWNIPPDVSHQASNYWKYVMATFNEEFAKLYDAEPADIPDAWKRITKEEAEENLKKSFIIR